MAASARAAHTWRAGPPSVVRHGLPQTSARDDRPAGGGSSGRRPADRRRGAPYPAPRVFPDDVRVQ